MSGPWASRRGFDTVVQTVSGITTRQGELFPGAEPGPQFYPVSAIDYLTGYLMAFGAMVALARRAREGGSWLVRISLAQTGRWLVGRGEVPGGRAEGRAEGVPAGRDRPLVDRERDPGRAAAPSRAHRAPLRDPAPLGAALGPARLQPAGLARPLITAPPADAGGIVDSWPSIRIIGSWSSIRIIGLAAVQ